MALIDQLGKIFLVLAGLSCLTCLHRADYDLPLFAFAYLLWKHPLAPSSALLPYAGDVHCGPSVALLLGDILGQRLIQSEQQYRSDHFHPGCVDNKIHSQSIGSRFPLFLGDRVSERPQELLEQLQGRFRVQTRRKSSQSGYLNAKHLIIMQEDLGDPSPLNLTGHETDSDLFFSKEVQQEFANYIVHIKKTQHPDEECFKEFIGLINMILKEMKNNPRDVNALQKILVGSSCMKSTISNVLLQLVDPEFLEQPLRQAIQVYEKVLKGSQHTQVQAQNYNSQLRILRESLALMEKRSTSQEILLKMQELSAHGRVPRALLGFK